MLCPFSHSVACCCALLRVVAQSLKPVKLLSTLGTRDFFSRVTRSLVGRRPKTRAAKRGSLFKTWPKPETAHESRSLEPKSIAPDFLHTFTVILPSITRTLHNLNLPLTRNKFCFPSAEHGLHNFTLDNSNPVLSAWQAKKSLLKFKTLNWFQNNLCVLCPYFCACPD